jgi:streptomycin 6-kinase
MLLIRWRAAPAMTDDAPVDGDLVLPGNLTAREGGVPRAWLATLPAVVAGVQRRWGLDLSPPFQPGGQTAWVAPARDARGRDLVLKVGWWHSEGRHEADGLRLWDGDGAVRVHAADVVGDGAEGWTSVLLLERCRPGTTLADRPEPDQDVVVAGLLRRLWVTPPAGHGIRPLQDMCDEWADSFERKRAAGRATIDPGLARDGVALMRGLPATADRSVLLCTDIHAANVLTAQREPWLVIDPKPHVGDPAYDPVQHMLNCSERLRADPLGLARRMAGLLDLDPERVRLWLFARCVQESPDWRGLAEVARRVAPG